MRKIITVSMIASAALMVSACGRSETTSTTDSNTMVTDMNAGDAMEGTVNDTMTNVDGAMGSDNAMMNDMSASNTTTTTTTNTTDSATSSNMSNAM